jgi:hypothetical protein
MSFTHVFSYYPAVGKQGELAALLTERAQARQAAGQRATLAAQLYGEHARYVLAVNLPDLDAIEKLYDDLRTDPAVAAFAAKSAPLMRAPIRSELHEVLIEPSAPGGRWMARGTNWPILGRQAELQAVMAEVVKAEAAAGTRGQLTRPVASDDNPSFSSIYRFDTLGEFGKFRERRQMDTTTVQKLAALITRPPRVELLQILAPAPI